MPTTKKLFRGFCLLILGFCIPISQPGVILGQATGTIEGRVLDETQAVIPGVTLIASHVETGSSRTAFSNDLGLYRITNLAVGNYEVRAELTGFSTQVRDGIRLSVGQEAVIDFTMRVGEISEVVSVTGEAPIINTTSATVSGLVSEQTVRDLPLNARNLLALVPLYTGAAFSDTGAQSVSKGYGTKLSISGTRYNTNLFLLDGTDIRDGAGGAGSAAGGMIGVETIREFEVITNAFSANYGNHSGGVFNAVSKSGTNEFHGSAFEFLRNDNLDVKNFFDEEKLEFKRNQFGATGGGPIVRERTFVFGSYEGLRENLGLTQFWTVPNVDARNGILPGQAQVPVDPDVKEWLDAYPLPNSKDLGEGRAEFTRSLPQVVEEDFITVRVDHQLTDSNTLYGRYTWTDGTRADPNSGLGHILENRTIRQYFTLNNTHVFAGSVVNEFMAGATRTDLNTTNEIIVNLPQATFTGFTPLGRNGTVSIGGFSTIGGASIDPRLSALNVFQFKDDVSYSRGGHSIRFGAEFTRYQQKHQSPFGGAGAYSFRDIADAWASDVDRFNALFTGFDPFYGRQSYFGIYVQDDIKWTPNLTVNLGLRYEFMTTLTEKFGQISNARQSYLIPGITLDDFVEGDPFYDNPSYTSFGPRLGIAWDPWGDGKTSVRMGGGIFFDHIRTSQWAIGWDNQPPFFVRAEVRARDVTVPLDFPDAFVTQFDLLSGRSSSEGVEFDIEQPTIYKWSLEIQREIAPATQLEVGYRATRAHHLQRVNSVNQTWPLEIREGRIFAPAGQGILHPAMSRVRPRFTDVQSTYHAFNLGLKRRLSGGFHFQTSYTLSKVVSDFDSFTGSSDYNNPGSSSQSRISVPPFFHQKIDRALANFDVRQSLFFNTTYDLPWGTGPALGGWKVSSIVRLTDGNPFTVTEGSGIFPRGRGDDLDLIPGADNSPIDPQNHNQYFDPSSFQVPINAAGDFEPGFFGNLGRNTLIGPGVASVDLMVGKDFTVAAVSEEFKIQIRTEFYNLFNRNNFAQPSRTSVFQSDGVTPRSDAGRITSTNVANFQMQLGLKILW